MKYNLIYNALTYIHFIAILSYRWVLGTAGERNATLLSTGVGVCAVEVDVEIPIIGSKRPTALPLCT